MHRYFSATLLPLLLFHDRFAGLREFVAFLDQRAAHGRDASERPVPLPSAGRSFDPAAIEVITEFHIHRDLRYANRLGRRGREGNEARRVRKETHDAPDVVMVLGDEMVVIEAKFFDSFSLIRLNAQLYSQRCQIGYLFRDQEQIGRPLAGYRHVALLPYVPSTAPSRDATISWAEVANLADQVLGSDHDATQRLRHAVHRYEDRQGDPQLTTYKGRLPLDGVLALVEEYREKEQRLLIGHVGGAANLRGRGIANARAKAWKWRDDSVHGPMDPSNWIEGPDFAAIIRGIAAAG